MKNVLFLVIVFFSMVLVFEFTCFLYLSIIGQGKPFVLEVTKEDDFSWLNSSYRLVDPLLGWGVRHSDIEVLGLTSEFNSVRLKTDKECEDPIVIYITGGSTTDLTFDIDNWPTYFKNLLDINGYCANIYVSAVAGYNTGQELLKLIRDKGVISPKVHISYSGANEACCAGYVSNYEQHLYRLNLYPQPSSILPNTIYLLRSLFHRENLELKEQEDSDPLTFWRNNMRYMKAISADYEYEFIGFLQPVYGFGSNKTEGHISEKHIEEHLEAYKSFYPVAETITDKYNYLYNLTNSFEDFKQDTIFKDDCHLSDKKYQIIIAQEIFGTVKCYLDIPVVSKK